MIIEGDDLLQTRFRASVYELDQGADFAEGHRLDDASAALVPARMIGRMLMPDEAGRLIRRIERGSNTTSRRRT